MVKSNQTGRDRVLRRPDIAVRCPYRLQPLAHFRFLHK
jgi:hypothetical protein